MLVILACAGFCAVLIGNPTVGLYLREGLPTIANVFFNEWLSQYLRPSQWQLQRAWTSTKAGPDWNILYHIGGNSPWIQKIDDVVESGFGVPAGCQVEQVHMVRRGIFHFVQQRRDENCWVAC